MFSLKKKYFLIIESIKNIDLTIKRNQMIGIIGDSGCGKSTFLDLLMGLLEPNKGKILVDENNIFSDKKLLYKWQNTISHVPQTIFLLDSSIFFSSLYQSLHKLQQSVTPQTHFLPIKGAL